MVKLRVQLERGAQVADVFISYTKADLAKASLVAAGFRAEGYSVFFDQNLAPGDSWDVRIERELAAAKAVVVLWSPASRDRQWVRNEARDGMGRGILCPALIVACAIPVEFSHVQAADLTTFTGATSHGGWTGLSFAVREKVRGGAAPAAAAPPLAPPPRPAPPPQQPQRAPAPQTLPPPRPAPAKPPWALIGAGAAVALIGLLFVWQPWRGEPAPAKRSTAAEREAARPADPADTLVGTYAWTGLACRDGPAITRDGDLVTITMTGAPTFTHVIEKREGRGVRTLVVAPETMRGQAFVLTPTATGLEVMTVADQRVDTWERCRR